MSDVTSFAVRLFALFCLLILNACSQKVFVVHYPESAFPQKEIAEVTPLKKPSVQTQKGPLIVIDAGHGGDDFGAEVKQKPPLKEKNLNLVTARLLEGYLRQMGFRTLMTRREDAFVPLDKRSGYANNVDSDLFVSMHYNSAPSHKAEGIEVFYYRTDTNKERVQASKALAETVLKYVTETTGARSRGVKHGNLAVIRKTTMPAILVEGGFLTNEQELLKLRDPTYIKSLAWGVAQGIQAYLLN